MSQDSAVNRLDRPVGHADHLLGDPAAPITLVEYGSYACPHCRAANQQIAEVRGRLGERLRYVFRQRPLTHNDLARRAADLVTGAPFAKLAPAQQDEVIRAIEKTPFFQAVRFDTIVGTFALPSWGGNRDYAGWHMIGLEHQPRFQPPFGAYDVEANRRK